MSHGGSPFLPDPGYELRRNNIIDVLVPPPIEGLLPLVLPSSHDNNDNIISHHGAAIACKNKTIDDDSSINDENTQRVALSKLQRPSMTTPGYDIHQYDLERRVPIGFRATKCSSSMDENDTSTKSRKRKQRPTNDGNSSRRELSWNAFQPYLDGCIPVKIEQVALFRDVVDVDTSSGDGSSIIGETTNGKKNESGNNATNPCMYEQRNNIENGGDKHKNIDTSFKEQIINAKKFHHDSTKQNIVLSKGISSFPSSILDTNVTVQCAFPSSSSCTNKMDANNSENNDKPFISANPSAQEIDNAISFSTASTCRGIIIDTASGDNNNNNTGKIDLNNNNNHNNNCNDSVPIFMGQEDQITTEMTLREAITWNRFSDDAGDADSSDRDVVSRPLHRSKMAVCVAQEPILTISSHEENEQQQQQDQQHEGSKTHDPINNNMHYCNLNQKIKCNKKSRINVHLDGRVYQSYYCGIHDEEVSLTPNLCNGESELPSSTTILDPNTASSLPMAPLASMLCLPSYLLLGNPNELNNDCHDCHRNHCNGIVIHNINLWHAPQHCRTNVHYDERDNLLLVTEGVKTVELCPPGCIRGSGVYSEHANHPALLRRRMTNNSNDEKQSYITEEVKKTRELKQCRTFIVSVSAGEGLYIPRGWWHRVESTCSSSIRQRDHGCTAVNIWFEYRHVSRHEGYIPKHMLPFHLRQSARSYFDLHADYATRVILEQKRKTFLCKEKRIFESKLFESISTEWYALRDIAFHHEPLGTESVLRFGQLFVSRWKDTHVNDIAKEDSTIFSQKSQTEIAIYIVCYFRMLLEAFLLRVDLTDATQVKELVFLWLLFPLTSNNETGLCARQGDSLSHPMQKKVLCFASLILGLAPESCFIITQAWERHASSTASKNDENNPTSIVNMEGSLSEVESTYKHFFELVGSENDENVRAFLLDSVEKFKREICQSFLFNGLFLG